jgi:hypothetical protein
MPKTAKTAPTTPITPKMLHLDASQRVASTKKGRPERLIVQALCGAGRTAAKAMTTDRQAVTWPSCQAALPPVAPVAETPAPTTPKRYVGKPAKPCADCGVTIYGTTVTRCVPCWKKRQAARHAAVKA